MSLFMDEPKKGGGKRGSLDFDAIGNNNSSGNTDEDSFNNKDRLNGATSAEDENDTDGDLPWYSAPPNDYIDHIKGYEMTSFDAVNVPPPVELDAVAVGAVAAIVNGGSADPAGAVAAGASDGVKEAEPPAPPPPQIQLECEVKITEEEARTALLGHLDNHCCYGKGAARGLVIKTMECLPAFHYELQTFSEKRETAWTYAPIRSGGFHDAAFSSYGYGGGSDAPPLPWEIEEFPTQPFKDEVRLIPVPNTCSTKSCHRCRGTGGVLCKDCNGKGWYRCMHCHGDGWLGENGGGGGSRERCFYCHHSKHGHGHQDCAKCNTRGKVNCATCDGQGQVRCYIQLSITWKVHTAEHIVQRFELPHELIRDVSGQVAYEEEMARIKPLRVSDQDISDASVKLVSGHSSAFADQRIVAQRHQVRVVPITRVAYEWKGKQHHFFVYGYENKVHLKKYPQDCCWGCSIL